MAYTVLARRYRSGTFDEVIGQEHIAQTLKKAITSGRIAHAYLFCGTRGTGKTSTARILAKCLNCLKFDAPTPEPCNQCESCLGVARGDDIDVIEIDAASNTGVDNVRDIIENARYRPSRSRFKIYIIDEVHMLSKSAFNALLKTLEEPPSHVKFILATTEPEKVLPTILSRCQRYDFRNIPTREIAAHLKAICTAEKIKADEDALLLVAKAGAGSMRDSLSLLDRLLSIGESQLTTDMIEQLLGMPRAQLLFDLAQAIGEGNVKAVLERASAMIQNGLSTDTLIASLVEHLRNLLILRVCGKDSELVEVPGMSMDDLVAQAGRFEPAALSQDIALLEELRRNLRTSQAGRAMLDASLVRLTMAEQFTSVSGLLEQIDAPAGALKKNGEQSVKFARPAAAGMVMGIREAQAERTPLEMPSAKRMPAETKPAEMRLAESKLAETMVAGTMPPESVAATAVVVDDEDDDDLPRPGKVWTGPSLAELARQPMKSAAVTPVLSKTALTVTTPVTATTAVTGASAVTGATLITASTPATAFTPATVPSAASNVETVDPSNLPAIWQALLALLASKGPALAPLLEEGRFIGIREGRAIIRYPHGHETMLKMLDRNGKKEQIRDAFTQVLGESVGIAFECETKAEAAATSAMPVSPTKPNSATPNSATSISPTSISGTSISGTQSSAPQRAPGASQPVKQQPAPADTQIRITADLCASLRNSEPLIRAVMEELGGEIVRVE